MTKPPPKRITLKALLISAVFLYRSNSLNVNRGIRVGIELLGFRAELAAVVGVNGLYEPVL